MNDASAEEELNHAFVLEAGVLTQIWNLLSEKVGAVLVVIHCSDRLQRKFTVLEQLLKFEHPRSRSIKGLYFYAQRSDPFFKVDIALRGDTKPLMKLAVHGEEQQVTSLRDEVLDILGGTRPWYSPLSQAADVASALAFFGVLFAGAFLLDSESSGDNGIHVVGLIIILILVFASLGSAYVAAKLVQRWFPKAVFAIGQGKARYESLVRFQWRILIALFLSVGVSIIFLYFRLRAATPH